MSRHPSGETIKIVGTNASTSGRMCKRHEVCGSVLVEDTVVRFRKTQVHRALKEETAIAVYWVSDGIDQCRVGFLPRHYVKHWQKYEGVLAQVIEIYDDDSSPAKKKKYFKNFGCCIAAIISSPTVTATTTNDKDEEEEVTKVPNDGSKKKQSSMPFFISRSPRSPNKRPKTKESDTQNKKKTIDES